MTHPPKPQQQQQHHKHVHDASPSPDSIVSNLWDEFWFFQNCLTDGTPKLRLSTFNPTTTPPPPPVSAPLQSSPAGTVAASPTKPHHRDATAAAALTRHQSISLPTAAVNPAPPTSAPPRQTLMKAPSLPPDIANYRHDHHGHDDDDEDGNPIPVPDPHKQSRNKLLQRSYSSMQHYSSSSSSSYKAYLTPSTSHRPPRDFTLQAHWIAPNKATYRHHHHHHHHYTTIPTPAAASRTKKLTFQVKKWKSLTDLEHQEVQGFKDLGFVFDADAGANINPVLLNIIPGLRSEATSPNAAGGTTPTNHDLVVTRPYLSEAWLMHRSAPPMLTWDGRGLGSGSPSIMKEKLRFWARAVASNVRQEC